MYAVEGEEEPVQGEISFQRLGRQVCELLDCHAACLLPGCPEPALRHPLLDLLPFVDDALPGLYRPCDPVEQGTGTPTVSDAAPAAHNEPPVSIPVQLWAGQAPAQAQPLGLDRAGINRLLHSRRLDALIWPLLWA